MDTKDITVMESFPDLMTKIVRDPDSLSKRPRNIGTMELGSDVSEVYTNFSQGQLSKTDNETDMAIKDSDSAFFTIAAPDADGNIAVFSRGTVPLPGTVKTSSSLATGITCWAKTDR